MIPGAYIESRFWALTNHWPLTLSDYANPFFSNYILWMRFLRHIGFTPYDVIALNAGCFLSAMTLVYRITRRWLFCVAWILSSFGLYLMAQLFPEAILFLFASINVAWLVNDWPVWTDALVGIAAAAGVWTYAVGMFLIPPMMVLAFRKRRWGWFSALPATALALWTYPWRMYFAWKRINPVAEAHATPVILLHPLNPAHWIWRTGYLLISSGYRHWLWMDLLNAAILSGVIIWKRRTILGLFALMYALSYGMGDAVLDARHQAIVLLWLYAAAVRR